MVISAGIGNSVEVISPSGEVSCALPALPTVRNFHTHDGNLVCGGGMSTTILTCETLGESGWRISHNLIYPRYGHSSWPVEDGVILLGSFYVNPNTTEIAKLDGTTEELFKLKYPTGYVFRSDRISSFYIVNNEFSKSPQVKL